MIICQSQHEVGEVIQKESSWKTLLYHSKMKRSKGNTPSRAITYTTKSTHSSFSTSLFSTFLDYQILTNWILH